MKVLASGMCLIAASASLQVFAAEELRAYRMGNYSKASELLIYTAGKDPVADYYLGRLYLYGYGHLKNNNIAMRYFNVSADKGYLPAVQLMAKYSLFQEKNPAQAVKWFNKAAAAGDMNAQMFMAAAYLFGLGVKPNPDFASKYYIEAAKNGNALAQFALAENFISSRHSSNNKLGLIWLNKSVNNGNVQALTKLGRLYIDGKLVPQDVEKGKELLNKAADQNYAPAYLQLGEVALNSGEHQEAIAYFNKAVNLNDSNAYLYLAHAYLQDKSPIYDANAGFLWTLKAAQSGVVGSKSELANLYLKGIGVAANPDLAKQWSDQAVQDKKNNSTIALAQVASWLSNNTTTKLDNTSYQLSGIFNSWQNPKVLMENAYNQPPQFEHMTRQELFKPQFALTQPNEVPINSYYDAIVNQSARSVSNQWAYPSYPLNSQIAAVENANSPVFAKLNHGVPYADADYYDYDDYSNTSLMDFWTEGWQKQANYMSVFNQLYFKALLGDAQSQFEIGQMFQYGLGVERNDESAIIFYQNAAQQQHLGAEYNLGLLYLERPKAEGDYQVALNWLTDSAFKGNRKSQYVLAKVLAEGRKGPDGKEYIAVNPEQAQSMLYLSAANNFGPAEYELAENLAREYDSGLSVEVKQQKLALIRQLYKGAADNGVVQALLPLAFYNAMDADVTKQAEAFNVAVDQAQSGDEKAALLLALLYDRGIGVASNSEEAMSWYQRAGQNPVTQFILGTYTVEGKGISQDKEKGMELLKQAANAHFSYADFNVSVLKKQADGEFLPDLQTAYNAGNSHAGIVLADYYLSAENNSEQMEQAKQIYAGLADKGDQFAQLKLAYIFEKGLDGTPDPVAAQRWFTASADQGNPLAQFLLGQFYQMGENGEPDYNLAKAYYQKAASQLTPALVALGFVYETVDDNYPAALSNYEQAALKGDVKGIYNLALMYLYGKGVAVDYPKAKELFTNAAGKGDVEAITQLAGIYFNGLGVPRDTQQGLALYKKAAELGNGNALYELGLLSETGVATPLNYPTAFTFYQKAADSGNERAMLALGRMYHYGLGVEKNLQTSANYYQKLADRQNAYAQFVLGTFFLDGSAGELAPEKGKQLLKQASDNGNLEARQALDKLDAQTKAQVSFVEPVVMNYALVNVKQSPEFIYLDAMKEWNKGDEVLSRMILQRLVTEYPNYVPAQRIFDKLNQAKRVKHYV